MTIGERIRKRRTELGLSVDYIAAKLNKNRATIYRYESDEIENLATPHFYDDSRDFTSQKIWWRRGESNPIQLLALPTVGTFTVY
jgi:DNA-binding XRE family transcriptional regulator